MKTLVLVAGLGLLGALAGPAHATVRRVPLNFATITAALAASSTGDTVLVAAGTYSAATNGETFPLQLTTNRIQLLGAGMDASVLNAQGAASVVRHDAVLGGRVSGFRITGGSGSLGGGVRIDNGNAEIDHNRIDHNGASVGGAGVFAGNFAAPWIHHNLILDNFATSSADVHGLRFHQSGGGVFEHNLVAHSDGNGLLTVDFAAPIVRDNIFYQNGIPVPLRGRGICWLSETSALITHNLFFQNQLAALLWLGGGGDFSGAMANAYSATDTVYGNVDADPKFVNAAAGDYHLLLGSGAIDAGDPSLPHDPDGTVADIGPYAYTHVASVPGPLGTSTALSLSPNPLRNSGDIRYALPARAEVRVQVVDPAGRVRRVLDEGARDAGPHVLRWDGRDGAGRLLGTGVYYVQLRAGADVQSRAMVVIR